MSCDGHLAGRLRGGADAHRRPKARGVLTDGSVVCASPTIVDTDERMTCPNWRARGCLFVASVVTFLFAAPCVSAQNDPPPAPPLRLEFPLFDAPYNVAHGYRAPSMPQALALGESFYEISHREIARAWGPHQKAARVSVVAWDVFNTLLFPLPGADAWVHEEYHRAVMGRRGIDSFNDVYHFAFFPDVLAVSHVADEDLVRLKRDHPAEQVRLSAAGIEGEALLVQALERNQFFDRSPAYHLPLYWLTKVGSIGYVMSGSWDVANRYTDSFTAMFGADIAPRDFTGHDFLGWVYDLHRPDEPYTARGVHPSGVGIDRYIKPEDLTPRELNYLRRQGYLQLLTLVDPFLFNARSFTLTSPFNHRPMRVNANLGHWLTSFGQTVDANIFLEQDEVKLFVVVHTYVNDRKWLPGIDAELLDYPLQVLGQRVLVSPRAALWLQPDRQRFDSARARPGGLLAVKAHRRGSGRWGGYVEVEAKSAGWVAGRVDLDANVSVRVGASMIVR